MWETKIFKFDRYNSMYEARQAMDKWLATKEGLIEHTEIFVENAYGVEWRWLKHK